MKVRLICGCHPRGLFSTEWRGADQNSSYPVFWVFGLLQTVKTLRTSGHERRTQRESRQDVMGTKPPLSSELLLCNITGLPKITGHHQLKFDSGCLPIKFLEFMNNNGSHRRDGDLFRQHTNEL